MCAGAVAHRARRRRSAQASGDDWLVLVIAATAGGADDGLHTPPPTTCSSMMAKERLRATKTDQPHCLRPANGSGLHADPAPSFKTGSPQTPAGPPL